ARALRRQRPSATATWARSGEGMAGRNRKAPLCRVGRSNEPAKAGGAAVIGCASGFLETEACTTRNLAALLGVALAQTSLRQPSRAKQEPRSSYWPAHGRVKDDRGETDADCR